MYEFMACPQCQDVMVLEDLGEVFHFVDVKNFFGYRCLACGHEERARPSRSEDLEQISLENRLMEKMVEKTVKKIGVMNWSSRPLIA